MLRDLVDLVYSLLVVGGVPKGAEQVSERRKDRLTYLHQHCQVDLTQVINVPPLPPR